MFTPLKKGSERRQNAEWETSPLTASKGPKRAGYSGVAHSPTRPKRKRKALPDILQPAPKRGPRRNPRSLEDSARLPVEEDPSKQRVEGWLDSWWRRQLVLVLVPCLFVWT
ncbi:hypothetical protein QFC24_007097 [Naganishia onofrii]|uniref:Uncharacterized protein n=1 Tax=Naganishia onofrii TaxID=1851511 RepID=A0ACC2WSR3_9TREE|nr:hypothetical protein QFC24_007097 [Naganishia onofrii]